MNKFILIVICIYFLLCPFYIFPSGVPQPADILVGIAAVFFLFSKNFIMSLNSSIVSKMRNLVVLIFFINTIYSFYYYAIIGINNQIFFSSLYYIFNMFFLMMIIYSLYNSVKHSSILTIFILISLGVQFILAIFNIQGSQHDEGERGVLFFNNPNQLGYYSLLMLTLFAILPSNIKKNRLFLFLTIAIAGYLVLYSGSRAALAGVLLLGFLMFYKEGLKFNFGTVVLIIGMFLGVIASLQSEFVNNKLEEIENRNNRNQSGNISEFQIRGYDRIILNPEYVFFGAGEGKNDRFKSYHQLEIHSALGTILFSYGILGLFLFFKIIYDSISNNFIYGAIILLPVIVYNITHNGLRSSLLWACLGAAYIYVNKHTKNNIII